MKVGDPFTRGPDQLHRDGEGPGLYRHYWLLSWLSLSFVLFLIQELPFCDHLAPVRFPER